MTTADELLAAEGAVVVPRSLASTTFAALVLYLEGRVRADGGELTDEARALLYALNRAAQGPSFAPETPAAPPATVMLGMETVAALMGCTPQWARRLAARGEIPGAQRVGRIWLVPSTSLDAFHHEREEEHGGEEHEAEDGEAEGVVSAQGAAEGADAGTA